MRFPARWIAALLLVTALSACAGQPAAQAPTEAPASTASPTAAPAPTAAPTLAPSAAPVAEAPTANVTDGCVTDYDPEVDYFPAKAALTEAEGFTVEYFPNYKVVTVATPWPGAEEATRYVLVQCGTPAPSDPALADAQVIEVPVTTIVTMSTTELPPLMQVGALDRLVGVDTFKYISTPEVIALIKAGKLKEVGGGSDVNVEQLIDLKPDLVMTSASGNADHDAHPKLLEAGIMVAFDSAWLENEPLGRAEWVKYMGLFFNQEAAAEQTFAEMAARYTAMAAKARAVTDKPTVLTGFTYDGTWYVSGGDSYVAQMLADAGAAYLWADEGSTGSAQLSFEVVYERAQGADFWLNGSGSWLSLTDVTKDDERYTKFAAFQNGAIYNNNARLNENGGNDYWESGVAYPDIVLADLITIFHPELLPDHKLYYYRKLEP